ncbi:hypothetical protein TNIN_125461 [Trichonephila inaurata madagascariensis]|uniref:Uncharacterized protein n=1 Tax=Trichonephila inaurata madagascariensis TaxID=2747483 RepID=A0A8X7CA47_9ARAC|nr:hypothetical protein TNIN_125461 [Trichonephila inaurata madagascariensis]
MSVEDLIRLQEHRSDGCQETTSKSEENPGSGTPSINPVIETKIPVATSPAAPSNQTSSQNPLPLLLCLK